MGICNLWNSYLFELFGTSSRTRCKSSEMFSRLGAYKLCAISRNGFLE